MKVPYVDLPGQFQAQKDEILAACERVLSSGRYILGDEVANFEKGFAAICETQHAIGVSNGTDALILALKALGIGPGDEVITAANSWISSASSIALVGATPVFADVGDDMNLDPKAVAAAITPQTRAIMPVHLTGTCAAMEPLLVLAEEHGLAVIEDAAQAVGSVYHGCKAGSMGQIGCFSLHPLKNLNAVGDAGVIVTQNAELAHKLRLMRNHGLEDRNTVAFFAGNYRLDALQAAILSTRLSKVSDVIARRRAHATMYQEAIGDIVHCPQEPDDTFHTYHLFVIRTEERDALKAHLKQAGISSAIHYPTPIHLQPACAHLGYEPGSLPKTEAQASQILSLPVHHMLEEAQVHYVIAQIRAYFGR